LSVKIRLNRIGAKKQPFYRIVVADSRAPRDGKIIEMVGTYDPKTDPSTIKVNKEKVIEWISKGAKPTNTVQKLFEHVDLKM
jgi:small subunit ribosomal protein S16